jgi:CRP-like cAMP-binding protein
MFNVFETYINKYASFTGKEMEAIKAATISRKLHRKQQILVPNDVSRNYTFVCSGCLRTYRVDKAGTEHVLEFVTANHWATEDISMFPGFPAPGFVEALEETQIIQITGEDYSSLIREIPGFEKMHQQISVENRLRWVERVYSMVSRPAIGRYKDFKSQYPQLCHYIPMYMIASYLGIARETLSRIRANDNDFCGT